MNLKSTVTSAKKDTTSLRCTIPEGIAAFLELKNYDKLEWTMEVTKGKRLVTLRKAKQ